MERVLKKAGQQHTTIECAVKPACQQAQNMCIKLIKDQEQQANAMLLKDLTEATDNSVTMKAEFTDQMFSQHVHDKDDVSNPTGNISHDTPLC